MAYLTRRRGAPGVLLAVVLLHVGLIFLLISLRSTLVRMVPTASMIYIALAPPPPPPPPPEPESKAASLPEPRAAALPRTARPKATSNSATSPAAPSYEFTPSGDWGSAASAGASGGGGQRGIRVPGDYAERVKARVAANLVRPAGATYGTAGKSGAAPEYRQCTIPYELLVDREGKVLSFRIESCGDPLLDAAAEAALRKSGPHPPPPNAGADSYIIYGTANFKAP